MKEEESRLVLSIGVFRKWSKKYRLAVREAINSLQAAVEKRSRKRRQPIRMLSFSLMIISMRLFMGLKISG